ncbi:unnamed protein product [Polarella glacialis]|uniref:Uncharacterized protein n=2 Tax=Polarella glacialis TaxID=89957 RepID=A0A813LZ97_POLGL|nr:unnamed protein product [Polarella glacialis]
MALDDSGEEAEPESDDEPESSGYRCSECPGTAWTDDDCADELQRRGIGWIPCAEENFHALSELLAALPMDAIFQGEPEAAYTVQLSRGDASIAVAGSAVARNMRWLWACDEFTLNIFQAAADACTPALEKAAGAPMMLNAACFVVVRGAELGEEEASRHVDWGHARILKGSAFTCLAPLVALPSTVGGLHFWPWDSRNPYGRITSLNMNIPFATHVHGYRPGLFAAVDGKLFHRTQPFRYERVGGSAEEAAACDAYEESGYQRVLVSLSIATTEARSAGYVRKMLRDMTPRAARIRENPDVFLDSESECATSETDSDCDEVLGAQSLRSVLQNGLWCGRWRQEDASNEWNSNNSSGIHLDLAFSLRHRAIVRAGKVVGQICLQEGSWHITWLLEREQAKGGNVALAGRLVQSSASVCLQGCLLGSQGRAFFCVFPPRPWEVLLARWRQFPPPFCDIGIPPETDTVAIRIRCEEAVEATELEAVVVARKAAWWSDSTLDDHLASCTEAPEKHNCPDREVLSMKTAEEARSSFPRLPTLLDVSGRLSCVSAACTPEELDALEEGCLAVLPEDAQRRPIFERFLEAASRKRCAAIVLLQGGTGRRPRLLRPMRLRSCSTFASVTLPPAITVQVVDLERALLTSIIKSYGKELDEIGTCDSYKSFTKKWTGQGLRLLATPCHSSLTNESLTPLWAMVEKALDSAAI